MGAKKNIVDLEARMAAMEKVQADGIDWLVKEIQVLFRNDNVVGEAIENHDTTIAAIRALLVAKGILTDKEIDEKRVEIDGIRSSAQEQRGRVSELQVLGEAAEAAGKEGHPPEAFIFGS